MKVDVTLKPDSRACMGASGTGKSHYVKSQIRKHRRVLIWDIEDEYTDIPAIKLSEVIPLMHGKKPGRYRFICSNEAKKRQAEFDMFCRLVFNIGHLLMVVEELRFVTKPSWAPEYWAACTLRGRKRGIKIIGCSQRPAQIDKDFLSGANYVRCGALEYPEDRKAMAPILRCDVDAIAALSGYQALEYRRAA